MSAGSFSGFRVQRGGLVPTSSSFLLPVASFLRADLSIQKNHLDGSTHDLLKV